MKAVLKKDLGKHKAGTVLHYNGYVFTLGSTTIMAEDVFTDSDLFEAFDYNTTNLDESNYIESKQFYLYESLNKAS